MTGFGEPFIRMNGFFGNTADFLGISPVLKTIVLNVRSEASF
jgi:hypothetical protein